MISVPYRARPCWMAVSRCATWVVRGLRAKLVNDIGSQAELGGVGAVDGLVHVTHWVHDQCRPERFLRDGQRVLRHPRQHDRFHHAGPDRLRSAHDRPSPAVQRVAHMLTYDLDL